MKNRIAIYILLIFCYYILPLFIETPLNIIIPVAVFILSFFYSLLNYFNWKFSILVGLLFIPSLFFIFDTNDWRHVLYLLTISLIGQLIGYLIRMVVWNQEFPS